MQQSLGPNKPQKRSRVCEMFHAHLQKFQLVELAKFVQRSVGFQMLLNLFLFPLTYLLL